jgi:hypothetical protein
MDLKWTKQRKMINREAVMKNGCKLSTQRAYRVYADKSQAEETIQALEENELLNQIRPGQFEVVLEKIPEDEFPQLNIDHLIRQRDRKIKEYQEEHQETTTKPDQSSSDASIIQKLVEKVKHLF